MAYSLAPRKGRRRRRWRVGCGGLGLRYRTQRTEAVPHPPLAGALSGLLSGGRHHANKNRPPICRFRSL